jgi:hypothetical protein
MAWMTCTPAGTLKLAGPEFENVMDPFGEAEAIPIPMRPVKARLSDSPIEATTTLILIWMAPPLHNAYRLFMRSIYWTQPIKEREL